MPRRDDIDSICVIGSGPIVIGQACEFDYAGCQALKVLREEGYRTIVVNSNPATIMTDPGLRRPHVHRAARPRERRFRPRARAPRRAPADARRPDRAQPRGVAGPGGRPRGSRRRADRSACRGHPPGRGSRALPRRRPLMWPRGAGVGDRDVALRAGRHPRARGRSSGVHARRPRRWLRRRSCDARLPRRARPLGVADRAGPRRGVGARLGRVRARSHARSRGQRRHRLLDREPRSDGRAHGRLGHGRPADDALGRGLPGAARRRLRDHPRGRGRDGRLEHPVRTQPRHR